jgi:hypothetical protein
MSATDVIAVTKKRTEKWRNFFKPYFGYQKFFVLIFFWFCIENKLNKNQ